MASSNKNWPKYVFAFLATLIAIYALSYYWHSDNPFNARYHDLNSLGIYSHFIGAGLALLIGGFQAFTKVGSGMHRLLGYAYCLSVVVGAAGGCYFSFHSHLGAITGLGFFIADVLWIITTFLGVKCVRAGRIRKHRSWMWRSMALTSAGISLRIQLPLLNTFLSFDTSYILVAWLSWIGNLIAVELYLHFSNSRFKSTSQIPSLKGI